MRIRHFIAFVLAVGVLTGCASSPTSTSGTGSSGGAAGAQSSGLDVSWAEHYKTVADLKEHSDLAVQGKITKLIKESVDAKGLPSREYQFDVSATLVDPKHRLTGSAPTLTLIQTGGTVNGKVFQVSDDPLFAVNDELVLFLKEGTADLYHVVGGPNGRYSVTNGTVKPFSAQTATTKSGTTAAFAAEVKNS
jgi:hypothetical protein